MASPSGENAVMDSSAAGAMDDLPVESSPDVEMDGDGSPAPFHVSDYASPQTTTQQKLEAVSCVKPSVEFSTNEEFIRRIVPVIDSGIRRWVGSYRSLFPSVLEALGFHFNRPDMRQALHAGGAELLDSFRKMCHENVGQILTSLPAEMLANRHVQRQTIPEMHMGARTSTGQHALGWSGTL